MHRYQNVQDSLYTEEDKSKAGDMWDRYDQLYKKFTEATKENTELEKELKRLHDQQKLLSMKKSALGGDVQ